MQRFLLIAKKNEVFLILQKHWLRDRMAQWITILIPGCRYGSAPIGTNLFFKIPDDGFNSYGNTCR